MSVEASSFASLRASQPRRGPVGSWCRPPGRHIVPTDALLHAHEERDFITDLEQTIYSESDHDEKLVQLRHDAKKLQQELVLLEARQRLEALILSKETTDCCVWTSPPQAVLDPLLDVLGTDFYGNAFETVAILAQASRAWHQATSIWRAGTSQPAVAACGAELERLHRHSPQLCGLLLIWSPSISVLSLQRPFEHLQDLWLDAAERGSRLDEAAENFLSGCPQLRFFSCTKRFGMFSLHDDNCKVVVGDRCLHALGRCCPWLQEIEADFSGLGALDGNVTDKGVMALARGCPDLRKLDIDLGPSVTDLSIVILAHRCKHLRYLNIFDTTVTDVAISELTDSCQELEFVKVSIDWTIESPRDGSIDTLTDHALDDFAGLRSLRTLYVGELVVPFSEAAQLRFHASRPDVDVAYGVAY